MRVAIIHDWLTGMRGGEAVLEELCTLYPKAEIYTLVHLPQNISPGINRLRIHTSFIQKLPFAQTRHQRYLPLFPLAVESFDVTGYDLVISTSHCIAKGVITRPRTCHVCYVHAPMRYAWELYHQYVNQDQLGTISRWLIGWQINKLRIWDRLSADRVDYFIANSKHTAKRINKHYRRRARVIYPPVATDFFTPGKEASQNHFLIVSALVPYKRVELAVAAFNQLQLPLVIIGDGSERKKLEKMAASNITFLGRQPAEKIREYYRSSQALIFPGEEDFGIVPVEAQGCGCPVIGYGVGGLLETVIDGKTGLFFPDQTVTSIVTALKKFSEMSFSRPEINRQAKNFSKEQFKTELIQFVSEKYHQYNAGENIPTLTT